MKKTIKWSVRYSLISKASKTTVGLCFGPVNFLLGLTNQLIISFNHVFLILVMPILALSSFLLLL